MSEGLEYDPGEEVILTVDDTGKEIYKPISEIPELRDEYRGWKDAMITTYEPGQGEDNGNND